MTDELKAWEAKPPKGAPKVVLVSTGTIEANAEMGLKSTTVLDEGFQVGRSFGAGGTPSAVLVDKDGKIASDLAVGQPSVMALANGEDPKKVAAAAQNAAPARPAQLKRGEKAPEVELNDLDGAPFKLSAQKGKETVLVFWNPGCGFCRKMTDELKEWESAKPDSAAEIVLVSTGTAEANQALGLTSRTLLDEGFATGRKFGATGTPSAVKIDKNGKVASEVAVGGPAVLALAGAEAIRV
jgi:peroxiredoxin